MTQRVLWVLLIHLENKASPSGSYALDVNGIINSNTDIQINGVSVVSSGSVSVDDATALAIALG